MQPKEQIPTYVVAADASSIVVECHDLETAKKLLNMGFAREFLSKIQYVIKAEAEAKKLEIFQELQKLEVAFLSLSHDWPPSELVEEYIANGQLAYPYKAIAWTGPRKWYVYEVTGTLPVVVLARSKELKDEMQKIEEQQMAEQRKGSQNISNTG